MDVYVLNYYNSQGDNGVCYVHTDKNKVVNEAIELSSEDGGEFTYRMETWNNGECVGEFRFFQDGKEFTQELISLARYLNRL
jgi:hypothetical protein